MSNSPKAARQVEILLDLAGGVVGTMLLALAIKTYGEGGSAGWVVAGAVLFLIDLGVVRRRFARRGKPWRCTGEQPLPRRPGRARRVPVPTGSNGEPRGTAVVGG
ncbi:hypothetical protein ACSHXN_13205 [Streptomyces sp. HUAS TT11]|uniref:hypothetical protein n=1 Tax=Streptomyces sp. HUAS TT11 TaxID=3447508 RepID=UPI003F65A829